MEKCHFCNHEDEAFYVIFKDEIEFNACPDCYNDMFDKVDVEWLDEVA